MLQSLTLTLSLEHKALRLLGPGNYRRIARLAGLAPQHVGRVLKGQRGASFHVAFRISEAAGVTLDQLYHFIIKQPKLIVRGRRTRRDIPGYRPDKKHAYLSP